MRCGALFSWLFGPGRPLIMLVLLVDCSAAGPNWRGEVRDRILASPEYRIGPSRSRSRRRRSGFDKATFASEVFRSPTLDGPLSIMDDDLVERIAKAFARHPWVARSAGHQAVRRA